MIRVVFFDKKKETYEVVNNVTHMHTDFLNRKNVFVLYTEEGIKLFPRSQYTLHKIDC
jgi:hypothetical protein